jgi:transposase InsO family protein
MKFRIIHSVSNTLNVKYLCKMINVSRSGYYYWLKHRGNQSLKDKDDFELIKKIFEQKHRKAGWRTIKMILENDYGTTMNHKKIRRIKNEYGLHTKIRTANPYKAIAKKTKEHSTCANILDREFKVSAPHKVYCTDITYLFYGKGKRAYLSAVKDLATKEIVAYHLSQNIDMEIIWNTLAKAVSITPESCFENLIWHSDQGFHYTHPIFREKLKELKITQSMSRKGNCIDNAPIESFFGHLKDELDYKTCATFRELELKVNEYIYYYNNNRYQWNLKKMTPVEYRDHLLIA